MRARAYLWTKPSNVEWLGDIPRHWSIKRGRFCMRINPPSEKLRGLNPESEISFVPMDNVGEYGGIRLDSTVIVGEATGSYTEFQDGDVIVAKITPCFENGKGALASGLVNGVALGTTELHVLRVGPDLDNRFLFYLTISSWYRRTGEAEMYGAGGQKRVPPEFNKNLQVSLPPLAEQCAIAEYLDAAIEKLDRLVGGKQELIEKLKEKRKALISHVVTRGLDPSVKFKPSGIEWLGEIPEHWGASRLGFLVSKIGSGKTPKGGAEGYQQSGIMLIRSQNVYDDGLRLDDVAFIDEETDDAMATTRVKPNDVLLNITGASLGRCTLVPPMFPPANVNQHVCIIRPSPTTVNASFARYALIAEFTKAQIFADEAGSSREGLNFEQVRDLVLPVPPPDEQMAIAAHLDRETSALDLLASKVDLAIERLREYRSALITAAVTGKMDLRKESE